VLTKETRVVLTDIEMPFLNMILFMVKWGLAAIPAVIVIWAILSIVGAVLGIGLFGHK